MLGCRLMVMHNLYFYNILMKQIRDAIEEGRFKEFKRGLLESMEKGED